MKKILLITGLLILFAAEILRVYLVMPFTGSQQTSTVGIAYFIERYIWYTRIIIGLLVLIPLVRILIKGKRLWVKGLIGGLVLLYCFVFYNFNYKLPADKLFFEPKNKIFTSVADNKVAADKQVVGIVLNGEAKAYPVELIAYHHQVQDTVAGQAILVTYCGACRTGRIYNPVINGKAEKFRLVGMDQFNAMFEDNTTKSWWQQSTGKAITGPLKGTVMAEIPSQQVALSAWLRAYPNSLVLQPDPVFAKRYESYDGYDKGEKGNERERRDLASWKNKSWVVGVAVTGYAKAYDWNDLVKQKLISDSLPNIPLIVTIEKDTTTFHVWNRLVNGQSLQFVKTETGITDTNTNSLWNDDGICVEGTLNGQRLKPVQASLEFWHAWQDFHPGTKKYEP